MHHFELSSGIPAPIKDFFLKSATPLSLSDALKEDRPLVGVNTAFCALTGYDPDEVLGRNCRFLQPEGPRMEVCDRIRDFFTGSEENSERFAIPNRRKDGTPFLNILYISKLQKDGETTHYLGSQFDFTRHGKPGIDLYEKALSKDLRKLNSLAKEDGYIFLGSIDALASAHALIAQAKFD